MSTTFPGTTIEVSKIQKNSSKILFDGIFATGGLTLSQVSNMTGLEPYLIQNWVKRGFVGSPKKRLYSKNQFARIIIINMLRESLQIDKICYLIKVISGVLDDESDDLISADELYHKYVDLISEIDMNNINDMQIFESAQNIAKEYNMSTAQKNQLIRIMQIMVYAHIASTLRKKADDIFATLD